MQQGYIPSPIVTRCAIAVAAFGFVFNAETLLQSAAKLWSVPSKGVVECLGHSSHGDIIPGWPQATRGDDNLICL